MTSREHLITADALAAARDHLIRARAFADQALSDLLESHNPVAAQRLCYSRSSLGAAQTALLVATSNLPAKRRRKSLVPAHPRVAG